MTNTINSIPDIMRRRFLTSAALGVAAASVAQTGSAAIAANPGAAPGRTEPFWGVHQGGIATPIQRHTYFIAFDLITTRREDVIRLLRVWTDASALMTGGPAHFDLKADHNQASIVSPGPQSVLMQHG